MSEKEKDLTDLLNRVRRIEITAQRLVVEQLSGRYHSIFKGRGMSFDEVRPYAPGDEIRMIDWNVSARTGEVFVKQFTEERELTIMIVADASPSMDFGLSSAEYRRFDKVEKVEDTKRMVSALIAACIALSAQMNNDRVGLITFGEKVCRFIPPKKGRQHALRVIREVLAMQSEGRQSDLSNALSFLGNVIKRRSAVFIISDFEVPTFEHALRITARRHDVHALVVSDPIENKLVEGALIPLCDAESGEIKFVWTTKSYIQRFIETRKQRNEQLVQIFKRLRVPFTLFSTDQPFEKPLSNHFARLRRKAL